MSPSNLSSLIPRTLSQTNLIFGMCRVGGVELEMIRFQISWEIRPGQWWGFIVELDTYDSVSLWITTFFVKNRYQIT